MTIKVPANAKKADIDKLFKELNKNEKPFDARNYIRHYVNLIFCNYLIINKLKILFF